MVRWWYIAGNKRQGPVTLPTIKRLLSRQELNAQSVVWREGYTQWTRLDAATELKPLLKSTPPPLPLAKGAMRQPSALYHTALSPLALPKKSPKRLRVIGLMAAACVLTLAANYMYPRLPMEQIVLGAKALAPALTGPLASDKPDTAQATLGQNQWQNPVTLKQADLEGWIVKPLAAGKGSVASSFISDNAVVTFSVGEAKNQTLNALVNYIKNNDSALRFINQGIYGHAGDLPNWTGIATGTEDHAKSYVVHVTNAPNGYGILIAAINQQTANSVSRLEALMAQLDHTF